MCGIVGYVGLEEATPHLIAGLRRLEYRGYDSAGLATFENGSLHVRRTAGRVQSLAERVDTEPAAGTAGIAHTRWATHGSPNVTNAHPHCDLSGRFALVHNGIIENHATIRTFLQERGIAFQSETDTEALVQLIGYLYEQHQDVLASLQEALRMTRGTFGIAMLSTDAPQTVYAARRGSPLIVGMSDRELFVASDAAGLVGRASHVSYLADNEIVELKPEGMRATTIDAVAVEKRFETLDLTLDEIELGTYEHFMLKEIHEQPEALKNCLRGRVQSEAGELVLGGLTSMHRELPHCKRVLLFGCGSAWHASLIGEYWFEEIAELPTTVEYASELRYRNPIVEEGTLAIAVSQSGETADTLAALEEVKVRGARVVGVVNVVGSTIARETDAGVYLHVGPEIGVASTKAFSAQVLTLAMMATYLGRRRRLSHERLGLLLDAFDELPDRLTEALEVRAQMRALARRLAEHDNWLYLGRGVNFPTALEGALKLKEVSYIHAEGLPAAEMKHGPIAMIDQGMPVVVIAAKDSTYSKVLSNVEEVRSRGGHVIAIASEPDAELERLAGDVVYVPPTIPLLSPLLTGVPLQYLAYYAALERGHDVDRPRNLAKSVTVE